MGHSLGGLVASIVADRLAPRAAIYIDPAFAFPSGIRGALFKLAFAIAPRPPRSALVRMNPKWSAADVDIELATLRDWDKRTILGFADSRPIVPPVRARRAEPRRARREEPADHGCGGRAPAHARG